MLRSLKRVFIAVLLAFPGIGLAFVAKPLILGEGALLLGVLLAFTVPICWLLASEQKPTPTELPPAGTSNQAKSGTVPDTGRM
jgi:hypothetical protein